MNCSCGFRKRGKNHDKGTHHKAQERFTDKNGRQVLDHVVNRKNGKVTAV